MHGEREADTILRFLRGDASPAVLAASAPAPGCALDADNRALVRDGERVTLTPLEWGVLRLLVDNPDRVVTRDVLLRDVWRQPFAGSNKVDAVLRTLRRKLGDYAAAVETVTGHGYRFRGWQHRNAVRGDTMR